MESTVSTRRSCFIEDDGLASVPQMEAGFSGNNHNSYYYLHNSRQAHQIHGPGGATGGVMMMRRRNSLRDVSSISFPVSPSSSSSAVTSPRFRRVFDARFEDPHSPHFLQACFLCKKPLAGNRDIFMYRGDTPFCSEECREEQIEMDEAKETRRSSKAFRGKKEKTKSAAKSQNYPLRTGTVAAA